LSERLEGIIRSGTAIAFLSFVTPLPHLNRVTATAEHASDVRLDSEGLPALTTTTPMEFDGPGGDWSPETMLVAAIAGCFALTFQGAARRAGLTWISLVCHVTGKLDRVERLTRFVQFDVEAVLRVPEGTNEERARHVLARAEDTCLIARSLSGATHLCATIEHVVPAAV
jgi:organic hydroperoxide reductase OsmC/OhrA